MSVVYSGDSLIILSDKNGALFQLQFTRPLTSINWFNNSKIFYITSVLNNLNTLKILNYKAI